LHVWSHTTYIGPRSRLLTIVYICVIKYIVTARLVTQNIYWPSWKIIDQCLYLCHKVHSNCTFGYTTSIDPRGRLLTNVYICVIKYIVTARLVTQNIYWPSWKIIDKCVHLCNKVHSNCTFGHTQHLLALVVDYWPMCISV
jgi:hypothetical protein